jgi:hypothetical protein
MNLAVQISPVRPQSTDRDGRRWVCVGWPPVRPGDVLHLEGEVVRPRSVEDQNRQGTALVKWTMYNRDGTEVFTFTPIAHCSAVVPQS